MMNLEVAASLMDGSGTSVSDPRVVIFSRDPALARAELAELSAPAGVVVRVSSAYEAAAEILADPPAALVLDLRALTGRHVRLLEIARERHVEMLAVGALPSDLTADELSGVRLTARKDLAGAIERLTARPSRPAGRPEPIPAATGARPTSPKSAELPVPAEAPPSVPARDEREKRRYEPPALEGILDIDQVAALLSPSDRPAAQPVAAAPAEPPAPKAPGEYVPEPATAEPAGQGQPAPSAPPDQAPPLKSPRDLLTREELAALLGDEP